MVLGTSLVRVIPLRFAPRTGPTQFVTGPILRSTLWEAEWDQSPPWHINCNQASDEDSINSVSL
jgi:hypothetical protein